MIFLNIQKKHPKKIVVFGIFAKLAANPTRHLNVTSIASYTSVCIFLKNFFKVHLCLTFTFKVIILIFDKAGIFGDFFTFMKVVYADFEMKVRIKACALFMFY